MSALLLAVLGLGLAGLDPAGALLLGGALAAGASRRRAVVFTAVAVLGTAALGAALSLLLGTRADDLDLLALVPAGPGAAWAEVVLAAALAVWAVLRLRNRRPRPGKPRRSRPASGALAAAGVGWALAAVLDPTFLAVVVLAGRAGSVAEVVVAHLVWSLLAQAPLVVLLVAVLRGAHEPVVRWLERAWDRLRPAVRHLVTGTLFVVAAALLADGGAYLVTGSFLVE